MATFLLPGWEEKKAVASPPPQQMLFKTISSLTEKTVRCNKKPAPRVKIMQEVTILSNLDTWRAPGTSFNSSRKECTSSNNINLDFLQQHTKSLKCKSFIKHVNCLFHAWLLAP